MNPFMRLLALCVVAFGLSAWPPAYAAKGDKKAAKANEAAVPAVTAPKVAPVAVAPIPPLDAIWHTWRDNQGRSVDAMFCALTGPFLTLQIGRAHV